MRVIAVDYDGIINSGGNPIKSNINKVNTLFDDKDNYIVIYTARNRNLYHTVFKQLTDWEVKFHALVMEKMRADYYVDDKTMIL